MHRNMHIVFLTFLQLLKYVGKMWEQHYLKLKQSTENQRIVLK